MKTTTKKIVVGALALGMVLSTATAMTLLQPQTTFAESNVLSDFNSEDTTVVSKDGYGGSSTLTDYSFTSGNGADSVLKVNGWNASWSNNISFEFTTPVLASEVESLTVRYYAHLNADGTACGMWTSLSGKDFKWYDYNVQNEWVDYTIQDGTGEDTFRVTDLANADGYIDGFIVTIHCNGTPVEDTYVMFDSVTFTLKEVEEPEQPEKPELNYEKGLIAKMTEDDSTIWLNGPNGPRPEPNMTGWMEDASNISYVTNVEVGGETIESGLRIGYTGQWQTFGVKFTNETDMSNVAAINFKLYVHFSDVTAYSLWGGETGEGDHGPWAGSFLGFLTLDPGWNELSVTATDMLEAMTGEDGNFEGFVLSVGFDDPSKVTAEDSYIIFDEITYNWNCTVTFDCDTANSGIANTTQVVSNGKKLAIAPDETEKEGYTVEWFSDEARTVPFDLKKDRVDEDITLYAKYTKIETGDNTGDNTGNNTGDNTGNNTGDNNTGDNNNTDTTPTKKGCGSSLVGASGVALAALTVAVIGGMVISRKKKDN